MLTSRSNGGDARHVLRRGAGSGRRSAARSRRSSAASSSCPSRTDRASRRTRRRRRRDRSRRRRPDVAEALHDRSAGRPHDVAEGLTTPVGRAAVGIASGRAPEIAAVGRDRQAVLGAGRLVGVHGPALCRASRSVSSASGRRPVPCVIDFAPCALHSSPARRSLSLVVAGRARRRVRRRAARSPPRPIVPGALGVAARGQHHRQGLLVPARRVLDLVPGETVLLHVINGGLEVHEAVIGDAAVQDAWEVAEAATVGRAARPDAGRDACRPTSPGCASSSPRASASTSSGRSPVGRAVERRPVDRRLPHPRPLGQGDADPGPLGVRRRPAYRDALRRVVRSPCVTARMRLPSSLEEDPE